MKNIIFVIFFIFSNQVFSQERSSSITPVCNDQHTINLVYSAINKHLCMGLFHSGISKKEIDKESGKCSMALAAAGAGTILTGLVGSIAYDTSKPVRAASAKADYISELTTEYRLRVKELQASSKGLNDTLNEAYRTSSWLHKKHSAAYAKVFKNHDVSMKIMNSFGKAGGTLAAAGMLTGLGVILDAKPAGCAETIHMYTDYDENCRYTPRLGPNTSRFLGLSSTEQKKIMGQDPRLCSSYEQLAKQLESDFEKNFPTPKSNITSCTSDGKVSEVTLTYPNPPYGELPLKVTRNGNSIQFSMPGGRHNYELVTQSGWGLESLSRIGVTLNSGVKRAYTPKLMLQDPKGANKIHLKNSMRVLAGLSMVDEIVGSNCSKFIPSAAGTQPEGSDQEVSR